jgi:hypothetical protein
MVAVRERAGASALTPMVPVKTVVFVKTVVLVKAVVSVKTEVAVWLIPVVAVTARVGVTVTVALTTGLAVTVPWFVGEGKARAGWIDPAETGFAQPARMNNKIKSKVVRTSPSSRGWTGADK